MILKLSWRNVWRNRVRSLVVLLAIAIGLFGTLFVAAMSRGMISRIVSSSIENDISDMQIHSKAYAISEELKDVFDVEVINRAIETNKDKIEASAFRVRTEAMAASANSNYQVALYGIDTTMEKHVTNISDLIIDGQYFGTKTKLKEIVVGKKLVDELKVKLGSKIVLSFADMNGDIMYESFKVVGIFKTSNSEFDKMNTYVLSDDLVPILKTGENKYHEAAFRISEGNLDVVFNDVSGDLKDYEVKRWFEINPNLKAMQAMMDLSTFIMIIIVLVALIFGVINTMLMVVMERKKELGMLRALGMNNFSISRMIVLETVFLSIIGGLIGNALSFVAIKYFGKVGIKFESAKEGLESMGVGDTIFPALEATTYLSITILVLITALIASIFPVRRALKQDIAATLRN